MEITLKQAEIELALRQYVNNMFTMKNGANMSIEFSATRGTDGIIAKIDITHGPVVNQPVTREAPVTAPAPVAAQPRGPRAVSFAQPQVAQAVVTEEAPVAAEEEAPFEGGTVSDETQAALGNAADTSGGPAAPEGTEEAQTSEASPAPNRSLFGGLRKPKNG